MPGKEMEEVGGEASAENTRARRHTVKNYTCINIPGSNCGILSQGQVSAPSLRCFCLLRLQRAKGRTFHCLCVHRTCITFIPAPAERENVG